MLGSVLRRTLALLAIMLMLNTAVVAAQTSGGMKGATATEEVDEEEAAGGAGPCWSRNRDDVTDPEEAGLIGRREYESPQFGYVVEWTRDFVPDEYFETPVISFPAEEQDALCLWIDDASLYGYLYVIGQTASRGGPDADLEAWTDEDYIAEQWPELDVEVVIADANRSSAQVIFHQVDAANDIEYYTTYVSMELDDESIIYLTFVSDGASFEDAYQLAAEDVTIDGDPLFTVLDWEDIEAEL
jgi:hypothetical protein